MEVISLGLLAMASGVFLAKAKADKKQRSDKKEGFDTTDSLFGTVPQNTLPAPHKDFVERSVSYFNPLASLLNTNKTSVDFSSSNASENWTYRAPDNTTSANLFRSLYSKQGPGGIRGNLPVGIQGSNRAGYGIDDELGEKYATGYRVPSSSGLTEVIDTCETTPVVGSVIKIMSNTNGTSNVIYNADCSVFRNSNDSFNNVCGICHEGRCTNAIGSNVINTPKGLFVSSRLKIDPSPEELQMESLKTGGSLTSMLVGPTLGSCTIDSNTNKNLFSINYESCVANNKYLQCKYGQDFNNPNCYMCSTDGKFHFIDNSNGIFSVRQPTSFTFGGNGKATLRLFDVDGTTQLGYLNNPDSNGVLTFTNNTSLQPSLTNAYIMTLQQMTNNMIPWKIPVTSNGESAAGKYLKVDLYRSGSAPYLQGQFFGSLRSNSSVQKTDFTLTAFDTTSGSNNKVFYTSVNYGMKMQPATSNGVQGSNAVFKILVPYLYINTSNIESTYCTGPFIKNANNRALLSNSPCSAADSMPGNYSQACLESLFLTAGCSSNGGGFPSNSNKGLALMNVVGASVGSNADKGQIMNYVYSQFQRSWSGLDANGTQLSANDWNISKKYCTDSNTFRGNPCTDLPEYTQNNGPLSDECIKYIYANGFYSDSNNNSYNTYTNSNAASLFGESNSRSASILSERYIEPFVGSSKKDRFCTEFGAISPLAGGSNMAEAKSKGGIAALKSFYNNIHMKANQLDMTNAERAQWVAQCYGDTLNVEADANPVINKGIETSATTCGTGGLRTSGSTNPIGNIRAVRVWGNGISTDDNGYLQISQLVVLDSRGQNVALNKPTSYLSISNSSNTSGSSVAVDGTLGIRTVPNIYHSGGNGSNEYFQVDLGGLYDIVQIIYFNRNGAQQRATGTTIALYNNFTTTSAVGNTKNNAIYVSEPLTSAPVQYIDLKNPSAPASCPQMLSGQRGGLIGGQTTANGIRNDVVSLTNALTGYSIYNLSDDGLSLSLGGDTIAGVTTANWIWNHPYAKQGTRSEDVGFYTNIYNSTSIRKNYYLYYKCDDSVFSVIFNGITITSAPSGDSSSANTVGSRVLLVALPGQNLLQVVCRNSGGPACFIAAIFDGGSWISQTNSTQTNYYSATNAASTTGYSWRSYTAPDIGTVFQTTGDTKTIYKITNLVSSWHSTETNGAQWIWNQPDAGQYAEPGTVSFYINFTVSGIAVANYKMYFACDDVMASYTINNKVITTGINSSSSNLNNVIFQVVKGTNCLKVVVRNNGSSGNSAGFKAYIVDNGDNFVEGTHTASSSSSMWKCTTETAWSLTNACVYVPNDGITYNCAANIWGSNCTQGFTTTIYDSSPSGSSGSALKTYSKSNMASQLNDWWGSNSRTHGDTQAGSNRQAACLGQAVCETGYKYTSGGDADTQCTPNGAADDSICPSGYTYTSGFDSNSCQKTVAERVWTPGTRNVPWKTCGSYNYTNVYCRGGAENSIGYNYSLETDGKCKGSGGTDCCDVCGRNSVRSEVTTWGDCRISCSRTGGDCIGGRDCSINRSEISFAERKAGISCPTGYTSSDENDINNLICRENTPSDVESYVGLITTTVRVGTQDVPISYSVTKYRYRCESGYTRQSDGSCLTKKSPTNYRTKKF